MSLWLTLWYAMRNLSFVTKTINRVCLEVFKLCAAGYVSMFTLLWKQLLGCILKTLETETLQNAVLSKVNCGHPLIYRGLYRNVLMVPLKILLSILLLFSVDLLMNFVVNKRSIHITKYVKLMASYRPSRIVVYKLASRLFPKNMLEHMRLSVDWITIRVHDVEKNLALIFFIVNTSILVSKWPHGWGFSEYTLFDHI